jgi:hypothetical protein
MLTPRVLMAMELIGGEVVLFDFDFR